MKGGRPQRRDLPRLTIGDPPLRVLDDGWTVTADGCEVLTAQDAAG